MLHLKNLKISFALHSIVQFSSRNLDSNKKKLGKQKFTRNKKITFWLLVSTC
jgi:hypothetical protein